MRVCYVDRIGADAIWGVLSPIAAQLIAEGHHVCFVRMDDGGERDRASFPENVEVIDLPVPRKRVLFDWVRQNLLFAHEFRKVLRRIKPDIVHTNFAVPSIVSRWVAAGEGVPIIVSTQHELNGSMRQHYRWGLRFTERYCAAVVYVSRTVARSFGRFDEVNCTSIERTYVTIPNGVDIDKIYSAIAGVSNRMPGRIVCAGRMVQVKRQQLLIEALPSLLKRHPHIKLHLIGSGPMEEVLRHRVDDLGLSNIVVFQGWQSHVEVLREMASAELVVVPSDGEGFGLVLAEALVCGAPLLVSDIPVFREVLDGFDDLGAFFTPGNVVSLTCALNDFRFAASGEQVKSISVPAAYLDRLSSKAMAESYVQLYQTLTDRIDE